MVVLLPLDEYLSSQTTSKYFPNSVYRVEITEKLNHMEYENFLNSLSKQKHFISLVTRYAFLLSRKMLSICLQSAHLSANRKTGPVPVYVQLIVGNLPGSLLCHPKPTRMSRITAKALFLAEVLETSI